MTQFLIRAASVAAGVLALAGCASYEPFEATQMEAPRPNFPTRLPEGAATPAPQYDPAAPQARPTTPVQARPLEPAAPSGPGYVTPSTPPEGPRPQPSPAPTYNPFPTSPPPPAVVAAPPVRPQAPATRTVTRATVTGKVVEVDAPP
ncbi:MAG: hypothetical protein Q8M88_15875 [Phenylobacterium sp.]|uniref:hypothetical protein n=1 Tax=Phenylobacterium sp. TaxID=1871053 RepID=UPI002734A03F|nr:hypothetical protein [Phenylobacterium sp.]MDP3175908.1 hypothetical protein [Phenylobacterium sp.]